MSPRMDEEFALLLEGVDGMRAALAKNLLAERGLPSLVQGPDFDVAELGRAAHDALRGTNLYVPRSAFAAAREALVRAWGEVEELVGE